MSPRLPAPTRPDAATASPLVEWVHGVVWAVMAGCIVAIALAWLPGRHGVAVRRAGRPGPVRGPPVISPQPT